MPLLDGSWRGRRPGRVTGMLRKGRPLPITMCRGTRCKGRARRGKSGTGEPATRDDTRAQRGQVARLLPCFQVSFVPCLSFVELSQPPALPPRLARGSPSSFGAATREPRRWLLSAPPRLDVWTFAITRSPGDPAIPPHCAKDIPVSSGLFAGPGTAREGLDATSDTMVVRKDLYTGH